MPTTMATATSPGTTRRTLRFNSIDEALAEAERLVAAEREGRLQCVGSWKLGQTLGHLATWANFAFDGYPPEVHPPLPVRVMARSISSTAFATALSGPCSFAKRRAT